MTDADLPPPGDAPQPPFEELRGCNVQITCPPVVPHPGAPPSNVMLPNFMTTGTFNCNHQPIRLTFRLTKGGDAYCAPDVAPIGPNGNWSQTGWFECKQGPVGPPPPNGQGYTLTVTLEAFINNQWVPVASDQCMDITIDNVNGKTCQ